MLNCPLNSIAFQTLKMDMEFQNRLFEYTKDMLIQK